MPDCEDSKNKFSSGYTEEIGVTPDNPESFITRYRQDNDYQNHIETVWGARQYDTRPGVAIDNKTAYGIRKGWGKQCTGQQTWTGSSRGNGMDKDVKCCSKFKNGQMAFDLPGPANGPGNNHDCGYGWSGRTQDMDKNDLALTRKVNPPAWMSNFLALEKKVVKNTDITLESGKYFAEMPVIEQIYYLKAIYHGVCEEIIPKHYGSEHPGRHEDCGICASKMEEISESLNNWDIERRECISIIKKIFTLYIKIHELADVINRVEVNNKRELGSQLKKFSKGFLDLCNMIGNLQLGGKKSRIKSQKTKRKTKRLRKTRKNKKSKKSRKSRRRR